MDEKMLRQQALQVAQMRVAQDASTDDLLKEADRVLTWLKGESGLSNNGGHESAAAVQGQGQKP